MRLRINHEDASRATQRHRAHRPPRTAMTARSPMYRTRIRNDAVSAIDLALDQAEDLRRLLKGAHTRLAGCTADQIYSDICFQMRSKHASWEPCAPKLQAMAELIESEGPSA
jgi:hypothetical protein